MTEDEQKVLLFALAVERDQLRAERDALADALREAVDTLAYVDIETWRDRVGIRRPDAMIARARAALDRHTPEEEAVVQAPTPNNPGVLMDWNVDDGRVSRITLSYQDGVRAEFVPVDRHTHQDKDVT